MINIIITGARGEGKTTLALDIEYLLMRHTLTNIRRVESNLNSIQNRIIDREAESLNDAKLASRTSREVFITVVNE